MSPCMTSIWLWRHITVPHSVKHVFCLSRQVNQHTRLLFLIVKNTFLAQTPAHYWCRYESCLHLIIHLLGGRQNGLSVLNNSDHLIISISVMGRSLSYLCRTRHFSTYLSTSLCWVEMTRSHIHEIAEAFFLNTLHACLDRVQHGLKMGLTGVCLYFWHRPYILWCKKCNISCSMKWNLWAASGRCWLMLSKGVLDLV